MGSSASRALKNSTGKTIGFSNITSGQPAVRNYELESFLGGWASGSARNCADLPEERYLSDADPRLYRNASVALASLVTIIAACVSLPLEIIIYLWWP